MAEIDNLTRQKLREWQNRRVDVKEKMRLHPDRALEFSRVLDLMDEEHAEILSGATANPADWAHQQGNATEQDELLTHDRPATAGAFSLQLQVDSDSSEGLRKLLELALYELNERIDRSVRVAATEQRTYPGGTSGSLGSYRFELGVNGGESHD